MLVKSLLLSWPGPRGPRGPRGGGEVMMMMVMMMMRSDDPETFQQEDVYLVRACKCWRPVLCVSVCVIQ